MRAWVFIAAPFVLAAAGMALAIAFGGPQRPPPMASIGDPFRSVDWSDLPALGYFTARDGQSLAYRAYRPAPAGARPRASVVLIHGSSARSDSVHPLARGLARAGYAVYAPDVRGHGASGSKGRIAYVGQLEDDLEDLLRSIELARPAALAGFSAGGGFALRFAGGARQRLFDRYLLLSPFLHQDAATYRPGSGGWVGLGVPRIVALGLLNRVGVTALNDLPVTAFAVSATERHILTPTYSYSLAANFRPHQDWQGDLRRAGQPLEVIDGTEDEVFRAERFEDVLRQAGRPTRVTLVPGVDHIGLTLQAAAIGAVVAVLEREPASVAPRPIERR